LVGNVFSFLQGSEILKDKYEKEKVKYLPKRRKTITKDQGWIRTGKIHHYYWKNKYFLPTTGLFYDLKNLRNVIHVIIWLLCINE
jgi:hypothetical protein